jgi:hypothetical protein
MTTKMITAKTPRGAAVQVHKALLIIAKQLSFNLEEIRLDGCTVSWEEGPYEWAIISSMGGNIWEEEAVGTLYKWPATFENPDGEGLSSKRWHAEPQNGFALSFWKG